MNAKQQSTYEYKKQRLARVNSELVSEEVEALESGKFVMVTLRFGTRWFDSKSYIIVIGPQGGIKSETEC